jgi:hypothetical protein
MPRLPYVLDRDEGERLRFGETVILLRMTTESSGGALTIWEELPPLLDTPLHVHANGGGARVPVRRTSSSA